MAVESAPLARGPGVLVNAGQSLPARSPAQDCQPARADWTVPRQTRDMPRITQHAHAPDCSTAGSALIRQFLVAQRDIHSDSSWHHLDVIPHLVAQEITRPV